MIIQGLSYDKILDRVRETCGTSRALLLDKQDIHNIANEYGVTQTSCRHPEDSTSVRLIVEELKEAGELLYFKDQGIRDPHNPNIKEKEFILGFMKKGQEIYLSNQLESMHKIKVCMDSTHCISQYSGYQLTTVMTVSDLNEGFPVAFLISSTVNTDIVKAFLIKVKDRIGSVNACIFMSDDDPLFRNAWEASMIGDIPPLYLNCSWHTDRNFRKSIASKIRAPTAEKAIIYQMIRALMDEPEEGEFQKQCEGFLTYLLAAGFHEFHDYFQTHYLSKARVKLWPKCYRTNVTLHTNNHLENMHKVLKYIYLNGKKVKRLDHTLIALEKMVSDKLHKRLIDLMKNRTVRRNVPHFSERHRQGTQLGVVQVNQGLFHVQSGSYKNKEYIVQTCDLTCNTCRERCPYCSVCKCMYVCSCEDNDEGRKSVCKHIHAVVEFMKNNKCQLNTPKDATAEIEMLQEVVSSAIHTDLVNEERHENDEILARIGAKYKNATDPQVKKSVDKLLKKALAVLDAGTTGSTSKFPVDMNTVKEPSNKKIVKQDRLYSTKKKRKQTDEGAGFTKPSAKVRCEIGESLARDSSDILIPVVSRGEVEYEHEY